MTRTSTKYLFSLFCLAGLLFFLQRVVGPVSAGKTTAKVVKAKEFCVGNFISYGGLRGFAGAYLQRNTINHSLTVEASKNSLLQGYVSCSAGYPSRELSNRDYRQINRHLTNSFLDYLYPSHNFW